MLKKLLLILLLPLSAWAQAPTSDSTKLAAPPAVTSFTPSSWYQRGSNASNAQIEYFNNINSKWYQLVTGYQFNHYTGTSTLALINAAPNIYNHDGSLTSNRFIDPNGKSLTFLDASNDNGLFVLNNSYSSFGWRNATAGTESYANMGENYYNIDVSSSDGTDFRFLRFNNDGTTTIGDANGVGFQNAGDFSASYATNGLALAQVNYVNSTAKAKADSVKGTLSGSYQPLENQRLSTTNSPTFIKQSLLGTAGNGYLDLISQSVSPSSSTGHLRIYSDSLNRLSWKNSTYRRTFRVARASDMTISAPYRINPVLADSTDVANGYIKNTTTVQSGSSEWIDGKYKINGFNALSATNYTGEIEVTDVGATASNFTFRALPGANIRVEVLDSLRHFGINKRGSINSAFAFSPSYLQNGLDYMEMRAPAAQSNSDPTQISFIGQRFFDQVGRIENGSGKFIWESSGGALTASLNRTGTFAIGGSVTTSLPKLSLLNTAAAERGYLSNTGTSIDLYALNSFTLNFGVNTTAVAQFTTSTFRPVTTNTPTLGDATHLWSNLYTTNAQISLTGILKGNGAGSNVTVAVANTDYLPVTSPAMLGSPTAPTQTAGDNSTKVATTAYVDANRRVVSTITGATTVPTLVATSDYEYTADNTTQVVLTLGATCAAHARITLNGKGTGGWKIAQNAGDVIKTTGGTTTTGTGGSIVSSNQYNSITITCIVAAAGSGGTYLITYSQGSPTLN